jgi:hypothetical protein
MYSYEDVLVHFTGAKKRRADLWWNPMV